MDYGNSGASTEAINILDNFWPRVTNDIQNLGSVSLFIDFVNNNNNNNKIKYSFSRISRVKTRNYH